MKFCFWKFSTFYLNCLKKKVVNHVKMLAAKFHAKTITFHKATICCSNVWSLLMAG